MADVRTCGECSKVVGTSRAVCIVHVIVVQRIQAACVYFKKNSAILANPPTVGNCETRKEISP